MSATLGEAREAIRRRLEQVQGLDTVYGYHNGSPTPPCAIVGWPPLLVVGTQLGNIDAWESDIPVQILVSMGDSQNADANLAAFCTATGPSSVQAAFDTDPSLTGVLATGFCVVRSFSEFGVATFADAGIQYLACTVNLEVFAT